MTEMAVGFPVAVAGPGIRINMDSRPRPIDTALRCKGLCFAYIGHYTVPFKVLTQDAKLKRLLVWCSFDERGTFSTLHGREWCVLHGTAILGSARRFRIECDGDEPGE